MNRFPTIVFVVAFFLISITAGAVTVAPDTLIREAVQQLTTELRQRQAELEKDRAQLYEMVERVIVEHIAVDRVAKLVLARHWRAASSEQQRAFADEFKNLLIRTYASALFEYTGKEEMNFRPIKFSDDGRIAVVRTDMLLRGGRPIPVNYKFLQLKTGEWKIFDVTINGISLVTNYRAGYGKIIQSEGLDSLIIRLKHKTAESK